MKFTKKELNIIFKAIKILENGEELLGIDTDKNLINSLTSKISKKIDKKTISKVNREIKKTIKEFHEFTNNINEEVETSKEDFDREFGPNYPYSDTLKILNEAIENNKKVKINYYSSSQEKFTKREVKPKSIERKNSVPYLNAYCYLRNADRVFKLGRIKEIKLVK